ncbi:MAG: hypothetical protein IJV36_02110 [Prevotella sp.]|nr:hypothetical protein [Prevotella sp.]
MHENKKSIDQIITEVINNYLKENVVFENNKKPLNDEEIMNNLSMLVSRLHASGKLTQKETDKILFYGLYNNKHFQNGGKRSL